MSKVSIITPSFNKRAYVGEAINSVMEQSFTDWKYLIIENSTDAETKEYVNQAVTVHSNIKVINVEYDPEFRKMYYIPAYILNEYLDMMPGEYVFYLSDDDLLDANCFKRCVDLFESNPDISVCYFGMKSVREQHQDVLGNGFGHGDVWKENGQITAKNVYPAGTPLDCVLDGGQVAFRKSVLKELAYPYFDTNMQDASHCDGIFLTKLCEKFAFYPIDEILLTHRTTLKSTHNV